MKGAIDEYRESWAKSKEAVVNQAHALVERYRAPLRLMDWDIHVKVSTGIEYPAQIAAEAQYMQATILINPDRIDTSDLLEKVMRHEMIHLVLAPWRLAAHRILDSVYEQRDFDREVARLSDVEESIVCRLELILNGACSEGDALYAPQEDITNPAVIV